MRHPHASPQAKSRERPKLTAVSLFVCSNVKRIKKVEPSSSSKSRPSVHTHDATAAFASASGEPRRTDKGCRCGRTKCLKQYCACFRIDARCSSDCHCTDCHNDGRHEEDRMMAVRLIRLNDPQAFKGTDLQLDDVEVKTPRGTIKTVRGCRCRRSKCQKKYCECFGAGLRCSDNCICEDCENGNEPGAPITQLKPRPAPPPPIPAAKPRARASASSSSSRPPVAPKAALTPSQTAKVGMLVASARPATAPAPSGGKMGQASSGGKMGPAPGGGKMRKRNLSVELPNSNLHAKPPPSSSSSSVPGPPSADARESFGLSMLQSAGTAGYSAGGAGYSAGTAGLDSSTMQDQHPLESARSIGSLGTFTPTAADLVSPYPLQWGHDNDGKLPSARGGAPSPMTRGMSGLAGMGGGQPSPLFRGMSGIGGGMSAGLDRGMSGIGGMSGLDRGMSGLDRGLSGLGGHSMATRLSPRSPMMHQNYAALAAPLPASQHAEHEGGDYAGMPEGPPDAPASQSHDLPPEALTPSGRMMSVDFNGLFA